MKKLLQKIALVALAVPGFAIAQSNTQTTTVDKVQAAQGPTTAQVMVQNDSTTVISPRTGIRYTLGNTGNRPIVLKNCGHCSSQFCQCKPYCGIKPCIVCYQSRKS